MHLMDFSYDAFFRDVPHRDARLCVRASHEILRPLREYGGSEPEIKTSRELSQMRRAVEVTRSLSAIAGRRQS